MTLINKRFIIFQNDVSNEQRVMISLTKKVNDFKEFSKDFGDTSYVKE